MTLRDHLATPSADVTSWPSDETLELSAAVFRCIKDEGLRHDAPRDPVPAPSELVALLP